MTSTMTERKYLTGRKKYIAKQNELYKYKAKPVYYDQTDYIAYEGDKNRYIHMEFYSEPAECWCEDYLIMPKKYIKRASISALINRITAEFEHSQDYAWKFNKPSIKFVKLLKAQK